MDDVDSVDNDIFNHSSTLTGSSGSYSSCFLAALLLRTDSKICFSSSELRRVGATR